MQLREVKVLAGPRLTFNVEQVSLIDIDRLIDIGRRFDLKAKSDEFDDLKEYIEDGYREVRIPKGRE